jgi:CheY-like chemotaxis protein
MMNQVDAKRFLVAGHETQKVVVVNSSPDVLEMLESVLDPGQYDVVFVESEAHAYSQIKRVHPHLVVLCLQIEELEGFQLLSMLKLDTDTRSIPVLTYTTEYEGQEEADTVSDFIEAQVSRVRALPRN